MARFVRAALVVAIVGASFSALVGAPASGTSSTATNAVGWLRTQQQPDGGFELAGGFLNETMDAVNAFAQAAQTRAMWSTAEARAAVLGVSTSAGTTPLDFLDDFAEGSITKGQAAKLIVLVTNPLGLDPTAFDPSGDGSPRNLVTTLGGPDDVGSDHKFGIPIASLADITFAIRAYEIVNGSVPPTTTQVLRDAQQANGGWVYNGVSSGTDIDFDSTSNAVRALLAAGIPVSDADVAAGLDFIEAAQQGNGAWQFFGSDDPNSTAQAALALSAAGRTDGLPDADAYLAGVQVGDGRIASPSDAFPPINTFATSQSVEALVRASIPVASAPYTHPITLPAAVGGGALSLDTDSGALENVAVVDPATLAAPPFGVSFPRGLVSFEVTGLDDGEIVTVHLTLPVGTTLSRYFKFHGSAWSDATSLASFSGNVVTLTLTDGGAGDADGQANGVIVDPSGPAAVTVAVSPDAVVLVPRFTG